MVSPPFGSDASASPYLVGYACRLPGARDADAAWSVMTGARCTISEVEPRFFNPDFYFDPRPGVRGKAYSFAAGQMDGLLRFDAHAFGISPREASQMDPQQRVLLQTVWEALDHAGLRREAIRGDRTGVFIGASIVENLSLHYCDPARGDSPTALGNELSILANRVSAQFDFGGPSYVIDTACSSGLSALHQGAEALRREELDTAIVGAVHMVRTPGGFVAFSQARMLSPTGRCRAFDAMADGYVRSEGCIVFVLQRPEVAARLKIMPRARLLASGMNTDAGASPLAVPASDRQGLLIDDVLERSDTDPDELAFYEAHGTGTPVGDPAEAIALGRSIGQLRCEPLPIGSAKTNFGHPEPVAGLLGCLKAVLSLENKVLPASLHFDTPNPNIDFDALNLVVPTATAALDDPGRALRAGVSSFGFGGTNAVAILEGPAPAPHRPAAKSRPPPGAACSGDPPWLLLSAASEWSLQVLSDRWASKLERSDCNTWRDLAAAAAGARSALPLRRACLLDADAPQSLRFGSAAGDPASTYRTQAQVACARTVLAFPGNGAQFAGMGRRHYRHEPAFRDSFERCAESFAARGLPGLGAKLLCDDLEAHLRSPVVAQPLLFACQVALADALVAAGLNFDAVIGHSMGEISALAVAGALDLDTAVHVILSRSKAMEGLRGTGSMAVLAAAEDDVERALAGLDRDEIGIAAVNGPRSVTVSGSADALERLARVTVRERRLAMVRLDVEVPYHSSALEPLKARLMQDLSGLSTGTSRVMIASSTLGRIIESPACDADFFWYNARAPVRFAEAMRALATTGPWKVVEVAHRETLGRDIRDLARLEGLAVSHVPAVPKQGDNEPIRHALARAWTEGADIRTEALAGHRIGPAPDLPAYPWDEAEYHAPLSTDGLDVWGEVGARRLAGRRPDPDLADWVAEVSPAHPRWVADHRIEQRCILPATVLAEIALSAGVEIWPDNTLDLLDFEILQPAVVEDTGLRIRTRIDSGTGAVSLQMRPRLSSQPWVSLARGMLRAATTAPPPTPRHCSPCQSAEPLYQALHAAGLHYGDAFRRLSRFRCHGRTIWIELDAPVGDADRFVLDPMLVDACFHGLAALTERQGRRVSQAAMGEAAALTPGRALVPTRLGRLTVWNPGSTPVRAILEVGRIDAAGLSVNLRLFDRAGGAVACLSEAEFTSVASGSAEPVTLGEWTWRKVRLRDGAKPMQRPRGWRDPVAALQRIGYVAERPRPRVAGSVGRFCAQLAAGERRAAQATMREILSLAPNLADDLRVLLNAAKGHSAWDIVEHTQTNRRQWQLAEDLLGRLARRWHSGERLNVLVLGVPDLSVIARIAQSPYIDRLRLGHTNPGAFEFLSSRLPDHLRPLLEPTPEPSAHDLVIVCHGPDPCGGRPWTAGLHPGGLAVEISAPDLTLTASKSPDDDTPLFTDTGDALPLCVLFSPVDGHALPEPDPVQSHRFAIFGTMPDLPPGTGALAALLEEDGASVDALVQVHVHRAGADVTETLSDQLMVLRRFLRQPMSSLMLLCIEDGETAGFTSLSAGLAAAVRTLANEAPGRCVSLVSVRSCALCGPDQHTQAWWSDLLARALREQVVTVDAAGVSTESLVRVVRDQRPAGPMRLTVTGGGNAERVEWTPVRRKAPKAGEVEIAVEAAGLNFRDVMLARNLLPRHILRGGFLGVGLGMECAGRVLRTGKGCSIEPGQTVMALAAHAFSSRLVLPETALTALPPQLSCDIAAGVPVVFATAWDALVETAKLMPSERVLIHGGAGGVGLAAIQIARLCGAQVFATAGTEEKRAVARAFGAEDVFCSRNLGFADAVLDATNGQGVDVVLNSLSGSAMQRSVECLAPFGRFVEIGKRGFAEGAVVNLRPFAANLSYHALDLDRVAARSPGRVRKAIVAVCDALSSDDLRPLPTTVFEAGAEADALHHVYTARHVGKVVLRPPSPARRRRVAKVADDWVLIGGTGGIGLALADFLLHEGARAVHLVSRSGAGAPDLQRTGAWAVEDPRVFVHAVDATDRDAMGALFQTLVRQGRRLGGVVHCAMVMRDRLTEDLDPVETRMVIASKLRSAEALDTAMASARVQPAHVLYLTSLAPVIGNPGQIAYNAANAALEAWADARREAGLPGVAVGLGAISDTGFLTRNTPVRARMATLDGFALMRMGEVLPLLRDLLLHPPKTNVCIARVDWDAMARVLPGLAGPSYADLVNHGALSRQPSQELVESVRTSTWPEALEIVEAEVRGIAASVMRLPSGQVDLTRSLGSYGIDSLMAMELRLEIERRFGNALGASMVAADLNGRSLAVSLARALRADPAPPSVAPA